MDSLILICVHYVLLPVSIALYYIIKERYLIVLTSVAERFDTFSEFIDMFCDDEGVLS